MGWTKQPAIEGKHGGCLNCGPKPDTFAPDMRAGRVPAAVTVWGRGR